MVIPPTYPKLDRFSIESHGFGNPPFQDTSIIYIYIYIPVYILYIYIYHIILYYIILYYIILYYIYHIILYYIYIDVYCAYNI